MENVREGYRGLRAWHPILALATLLVSACGTTESDPSVEVTIYGTVRWEGGESPPDLEVEATAYQDACGGLLFARERDVDPAGGTEYRIRLVGPGAPFTGCLLVEAYADGTFTEPLVSRIIEDVSFRYGGAKSVRADLVVHAPPP